MDFTTPLAAPQDEALASDFDSVSSTPLYHPGSHRPVNTSQDFRDLVLDEYPALHSHPDAAPYRSIMEAILFPTFWDKTADDKQVLPYQRMAELVGVHPSSHGFSARTWMENFSRDVLPLNASGYSYTHGQARTIKPEIAPAILSALRGEWLGLNGWERVWFQSGKEVTRRSRQKAAYQYEQSLRERSERIDPRHHAFPLVRFLLEQPQGAFRKTLKRNWPDVKEVVLSLPMDTAREQRRRRWLDALMLALEDWPGIYYQGAMNSPRIFPIGVSVLQLPRDIRKIAFGGAWEMDLCACQLAVVARLWDISVLQDFLRSPENIWEELLRYVGLPRVFKPVIKAAVYSIIFGKSLRNLQRVLVDGDDDDTGIGEVATTRFFQHELIMALFQARDRATKRVSDNKGAYDAYGRLWPVSPTYAKTKADWDKRHKSCRTVLAAVVQSYELQLMSSVLPVLRRVPETRLLAYQHDGGTIHVSNKTKEARVRKQMEEEVRHTARHLKIETRLEWALLP